MADRSKSGQFAKKSQAEAFEAAKTLTKEGVLESVAKIRSGLDTQVAKIAEAVQEKLTELETVSAAVEFQKTEAERIHGVDRIAQTLEEAELNLTERRNELGRVEQELAKSHASRITQAQTENTQAIAALATERNRQEEIWRYNFSQAQKAANDKLTEEIRVAKQAEKVRIEDQERNWTLRELALKEKEEEFKTLKTKVEGFPIELAAEAKAASDKAFSISKKDKDHEIALLNGQHQAQRTVDTNTIQNLQQKLIEKDKVIEQLQIQLTAANTAQKEIATKALETSGNVKALADIQTATAMANNGQKRA